MNVRSLQRKRAGGLFGAWLGAGFGAGRLLAIGPLLAVYVLLASACASKQDPYVVPGDRVDDLTAEGAVVLDVRTREHQKVGTIPGAVQIPLEELSYRVGYLRVDTKIVVVAESEARSKKAAKQLRDAGFTVYEVRALD